MTRDLNVNHEGPDLLDMLAEHEDRHADGLPSNAARAVGLFEPGGPTGYRALTAPAAPIRATRAEAERDELAHRAGCDYQAGYAAGLHRAAVFVQDYGHTSPRVDVLRIQSALFRAADVAACRECNASGCVTDAKGRSVDHHPAGGPDGSL